MLENREGQKVPKVVFRTREGDSWKDVNDIVREFGGHWMKGVSPKDGGWRIPK